MVLGWKVTTDIDRALPLALRGLFNNHDSGGSRILQMGSANPKGGDANLLLWQFSQKICMKWGKIEPHEGTRMPSPPPLNMLIHEYVGRKCLVNNARYKWWFLQWEMWFSRVQVNKWIMVTVGLCIITNDIYPNQLVIDLSLCVFIGSLLTEGLDLDDNVTEYCKIKNKFVQF